MGAKTIGSDPARPLEQHATAERPDRDDEVVGLVAARYMEAQISSRPSSPRSSAKT